MVKKVWTRLLKLTPMSCRSHWHGQSGDWWCCHCAEVTDDPTKPSHRTAECAAAYSFIDGPLALPAVRNIDRTLRRRPRRRAVA